MKNLTVALISIILSSHIFAHTVRIINADSLVDMTVEYCASSIVKCDKPVVSKVLYNHMMGQNYVDVRLPEGSDASLQISKVTVKGVVNTFAAQACEGSKSGDTLILNTYATDAVVCDTRGVIEAKERN